MLEHSRTREGAALACACLAFVAALDVHADAAPSVAPARVDPSNAEAVARLREELRAAVGERDHERVFVLTERLRALHGVSELSASRVAQYLFAAERYASAWAVAQWCTSAAEPATRGRCRDVAERATRFVSWVFPLEAHESPAPLRPDWREPRTREPHPISMSSREGDVVYLGGFAVVRAGRVLVELTTEYARTATSVELLPGQSYYLRPHP
jgi:hypothetical protein